MRRRRFYNHYRGEEARRRDAGARSGDEPVQGRRPRARELFSTAAYLTNTTDVCSCSALLLLLLPTQLDWRGTSRSGYGVGGPRKSHQVVAVALPRPGAGALRVWGRLF